MLAKWGREGTAGRSQRRKMRPQVVPELVKEL